MPPDSGMTSNVLVAGNGLYDALLSRMPDEARASFNEAQLAALREAAADSNWASHPVDIRLSIPLLVKRLYVVFLCGEERRDTARRSAERRRFPLAKIGNLLFIAGIAAAVLYCSAFLGTASYILLFSGC